MAKRKKKRKRKSRLSSTERALYDRILVGLGMTISPVVEDGCVAAYILNPGVRGPQKLTVHEVSTWPAFDSLYVEYDNHMLRKLGVSSSALVPFWMGRFVASTEEDLVFGYMFAPEDRSHLHMRTLAFDYKLAAELFCAPIADLNKAPIPRSLLMEMLEVCGDRLSKGSGVPFDLVDGQAIDMGVGAGQMFPSGGGRA